MEQQRMHAKFLQQEQHALRTGKQMLLTALLMGHSTYTSRVTHRLDLCNWVHAGGTETTGRGVSTGEPPVNSKQSAQIPRPRSRLWNHNGTSVGEADSLQNAINAFTVSTSRRNADFTSNDL